MHFGKLDDEVIVKWRFQLRLYVAHGNNAIRGVHCALVRRFHFTRCSRSDMLVMIGRWNIS